MRVHIIDLRVLSARSFPVFFRVSFGWSEKQRGVLFTHCAGSVSFFCLVFYKNPCSFVFSFFV